MMEVLAPEKQRSKRGRVGDDGSFPVQLEKDRRIIRMRYRDIENRIYEEKDELLKATSGKFLSILNEVDNIHQEVMRPREQVSDAETLLGLAATFSASVKSHSHGGVTPGEFVSSLIRQFDKRKGLVGISRDTPPDIFWREIGSLVSPFMRKDPRCMTMIGPMTNEMKTRKAYTQRKRTVPVGKAQPEKIDKPSEVLSDTERNVRVMFKRLSREQKQKAVKLENLIYNRSSFAQTVENLFALSFLVKDGRVIMNIDEDGSHIIVPTDGPSEAQFKSGEVDKHQFIFRFDFADWKLMKDQVVEGEELMPHRDVSAINGHDKAKAGSDEGIDIPEAAPRNSQAISTGAGSDGGLHIPEAVPLNSQAISSKAGSDEGLHIPEAVPLNSQTISTKAGSDEGLHIPEAVPLNSQTISTLKATPIDSEMKNTIPIKKFSRNYGLVNSCSDMTDAVTVASLVKWSCKRKRNVLSFTRAK